MKSQEFCYWLQGFFELQNPETLTEDQVQAIKNHLNMVFLHDIDKSYPASQQDELNNLHKTISSFPPPPGFRC